MARWVSDPFNLNQICWTNLCLPNLLAAYLPGCQARQFASLQDPQVCIIYTATSSPTAWGNASATSSAGSSTGGKLPQAGWSQPNCCPSCPVVRVPSCCQVLACLSEKQDELKQEQCRKEVSTAHSGSSAGFFCSKTLMGHTPKK